MDNFIMLNENSDSEDNAIQNGFTLLDVHEITKQIIGYQFLGSYLHGFKYIISINSDGSLEGKNHVGHYDIGLWVLDEINHTLSVEWQYGWDKATTKLYVKDDVINMYDSESGQWRTSLHQQLDEAVNIKNYIFS